MGSTKLCLLLLVSSYALALAKQFKNFRNYVYQYEAVTQNGVQGASDIWNGPKVSCEVHISVPQTCRFVMRTTKCTLESVKSMEESIPVEDSDAFQAAMEKNILKVIVDGENEVKLYPEKNEPTNILNIKRGIISALLVPNLEGNNKRMATIYGSCEADFKVNTEEDIPSDVTITRDLAACNDFVPHKGQNSPLAIFTRMQYPLSKLISSTQTCNYKFDKQKKHMTSATCAEKHILLPFSHQNEYGITSLVKQILTLQETTRINDRIFDSDETNMKSLSMEASEDKSPFQSKDSMLTHLRELSTLPQADGYLRASIFNKVVMEIRGMTFETLSSVMAEMQEVSMPLTWQALAQCGTPECTSAMLRSLKNVLNGAPEFDVLVYAFGTIQKPSPQLVLDMLDMAQQKQSRPIMFALSNVVRKFYEDERKVTPEIIAVYDFMASIIGSDCAGDKDLIYLTLRVIANMGEAMEAAEPALKTTMLKCMRQPTTTLSVQMAAIQAFRRMSVTDEVRSNLQRVAQYSKGAVQKRLAAYLIVMRNPHASDMEMLKKLLTQEQNVQVKNFVASHVYNIIHSKDSETQKVGKMIAEALQINEVTTQNDQTSLSRHYMMEASLPQSGMQTSMEGNIIFDPSSLLPREIMLQATLEAFGHNLDIWEVGMEGKGFEPSIDALFGKNGFFPDTVSKAMYWVEGRVPDKVTEVLQKWMKPLKSDRKEVSENLIKEVISNVNKLFKTLGSQDAPEAMAYLRIMGSELGYIKSNDMNYIIERASVYSQLLAQLPIKLMKDLTSSMDNAIFAHYVFMENEFFLPTASGFPLKFGLSGTFVPGAKGGLNISPNMQEFSFMPSVGVEFVTKMGVHIPKFLASAVEMHTLMYHESAFNAKVTMGKKQIKLSFPAPQSSTQLFRIRNSLLSVTSNEVPLITTLPVRTEDCNPLFSGMEFCMMKSVSTVGSTQHKPFFPLSGDHEFAAFIKPTGDISEYSATFAYDQISEGKEGRQKADVLSMTLKAEGPKPTEAIATIKYNRNRNLITTSVQIPDYDVEAGIRVGFSDSISKGKKISIDIMNHNIAKMSLIGRAKMEAMKESLLQVQLLVPSLKTDASMTATLNKNDKLTLEIESDIKLPETNSNQKVILKYGEEDMEVVFKSDMDSEIHKYLPTLESFQSFLQQLTNEFLDQKVVKTDMKLRHIYFKAIEASQIWMDKISDSVPLVAKLRDNMPELVVPSMPEKVYMKLESAFKYQFSKDSIIITIPLPLGGKSSEDIRIPPMISIPDIHVSQIGLKIPSHQYRLPVFSVPSEYDLKLPLLGMLEILTKVHSNIYNWEVTISAGNSTVDDPRYVAKYTIAANSPLQILSYTAEGNAQITEEPEATIKTTANFSLKHKLLDTNFNIVETAIITDTVKATGQYEVAAYSPLGMQMSLKYTSQALISSEITGDGIMDGSLTTGFLSGTTGLTHSFSIQPKAREARADSNFRVTLPLLQLHNKIKAIATGSGLSFESSTNTNQFHTTKLNIEYKEHQFTVRSDSFIKADQRTLRNQIDVSASLEKASIRAEFQFDEKASHVLSVIAASLDDLGLEVNTDFSANYNAHRGSHKGSVTFKKDSLATSCTTNLLISSLKFENDFHSSVDAAGAAMSVIAKGTIQEKSGDLKIDGKFALSEVYLNSVYKGDFFNVNSEARMRMKVNEDGLDWSDKLAASYLGMQTDTTHSLKLNFGLVRGAYANEEMRHTFEATYADLAATVKCSTTGYLLGLKANHNSDLEIAGLSLKFNGDAHFDSPSLRFTGNLHTTAEPFRLSIDALLNSDGELNLYGKQSGQLISKILLKAENLAFSHSHEWRASTSHKMNNDISIETSFQNKIDCLLTPQEQSTTVSMESKLNNHILQKGLEAYNTHEKIGMEMTCTLFTNVLNQGQDNREFAVSGFLRYDKNKDSHNILLPFVDNLPAMTEELKVSLMSLQDKTNKMVSDFRAKYKIKEIVEEKAHEMKNILESFDVNMFVQDWKTFINSINFEYVDQLIAAIPRDKITNTLKTIRDMIINWAKRNNIFNRISEFYTKVEEIVGQYEIEKIVEETMDGAVALMKKYKLRERVQSVVYTVKSFDVKLLFDKFIECGNAHLQHLKAFNLKEIIDDLSLYVDQILQKVTSVDYEALAADVKQTVIEYSKLPCFGKLHGEFKVGCQDNNFRTSAYLQNNSSNTYTEFLANLKSQVESTSDLISYMLDSTIQLDVMEISRPSFKETLKFNHMAFSLDHEGLVSIHPAQASSKTTARANTESYTGELVNNVILSVGGEIAGTLETSYNHRVNMPLTRIFSETTMTQHAAAKFQDGTITMTLANEGTGKCSIRDFTDEGSHKSDLTIVLNVNKAKVDFSGLTNSGLLKMKNNMMAEAGLLSHISIEGSSEIEMPFIKHSVMMVKGEANIEDPKMKLSVSHESEFVGRVEGLLSNSVEYVLMPFEIQLDCKNRGNTKFVFPFRLSGKAELQNDLTLVLNPAVQQASWAGYARFNQYKYSHNFNMDNRQTDIQVIASIRGEANLDFLTVPIDIPEVSVPLIGVTMPNVKGISLWDNAGLSKILITPQQTFNLESRLTYLKNPDMFKINMNINRNYILVRDKVIQILTTSYSQAKEQYDKLNMEMPKALSLPAYNIPIINVDTSSFTIPMPELPHISMPAQRVPDLLRTLTPAKMNGPMPHIFIPKLGDLLYAFSLKTAMVTLSASSDIHNKENTVVRFNSTSMSEFPILNTKSEGTFTLNHANGLDLSTTLSIQHAFFEGSHTGTVILNRRVREVSSENDAKFKLPSQTIGVHQEIAANSENGLTVSVGSPNAGILGVRMQTNRLSHLRGTLYSRYPSDPHSDVNILGFEMDASNSDKLNIQATWNMEVPYEVLHVIKEKVPVITASMNNKNMKKLIATSGKKMNQVYDSLIISIDYIMKQGKVICKRASENLAAVDLNGLSNKISDSAILVLKRYQEMTESLLNAAVTFLRETQYQLPGFSKKLSGLEIYQKFSNYLANIVQEVSETLSSYIESVVKEIRSTEFTKLLATLKSQDLDKVYTWVRSVYTDALNCDVVHKMVEKAKEVMRVVQEYQSQVRSKVGDIFADVTVENLTADIQSLINSLIQHLHALQKSAVDYLKDFSKNATPYFKVSDDKLDINIPLPFHLA
ncbi:apolipoprotein B-100-like [Denticeps clupeoides]|uniref:apolipoprotein B-100-like n=1 Tax=Denticeps clupeoides TaxID=299321 RepID=UPI0010A47DF2|nr:apolipoprotein B-100-like [Denticeps clupeoides]